MFWHIAALVYLACTLASTYFNWKMHSRFTGSDELKRQNKELLLLIAAYEKSGFKRPR